MITVRRQSSDHPLGDIRSDSTVLWAVAEMKDEIKCVRNKQVAWNGDGSHLITVIGLAGQRQLRRY